MSGNEKLQKAIEATIAAGYQLNSEAFEFLSQNADTTDPVNIMNLAFQRLQDLEDKPFFIEKAFLETLAQQLPFPYGNTNCNNRPTIEPTTKKANSQSMMKTRFIHMPNILNQIFNILEDSTGKLTSNGTLEEYLLYFQDRFKRIEHLLRQRIDVRASTPILEALKSPAKTKLKIICMVTEKRDSKNQMILSVEDLQGTATVLIPQKAHDEVKKKRSFFCQTKSFA